MFTPDPRRTPNGMRLAQKLLYAAAGGARNFERLAPTENKMNINQNRNRYFAAITGAGVLLASLLATSFQSTTFAQESSRTTDDIDKKTDSKPMCPMMAGMKGIKLTAASPPLLLARADELKLTDDQKQELKSIAEEARRKATMALTTQQRSMLGESPDKAMSMMDVVMMRSKQMKDDKSDGMCPMCKKKMKGMKKMMKGKKSGRGKSSPN